jgi:death on curing protein
VTWRWIPAHLAVAWHARLIERFGGVDGIRDIGLLESASSRPQNRAAYNPGVSIEELAALYAVGVTKAHAFIDGNKRIAFAVMVSFLHAHGRLLDVAEADATRAMLEAASGSVTEHDLAAWLRARCRDAA